MHEHKAAKHFSTGAWANHPFKLSNQIAPTCTEDTSSITYHQRDDRHTDRQMTTGDQTDTHTHTQAETVNYTAQSEQCSAMHSLQWSSAFSRNHTGCLLKPGLPLSVCVTLSALRHHSLACVRTCCMQVSSLSARHITFSFMFHRSATSVRSSFPLRSPSFPPRPSFLSRSSILTRTSTSLYPSPSLFPGRTWVSVVCSVVTSLQDFLHCATLPCSFLRHLKLLCSRSPPSHLHLCAL